MALRPFTNNESNPILNIDPAPAEVVDEIPDELNDVLVNAGLANPKISNDITNVRAIFNAKGAGINDIADQIANILANGENSSARLKACEIAMQVQGIITKMDERSSPEIKINIIGSNNKTIVNLVCPDEVNLNAGNHR